MYHIPSICMCIFFNVSVRHLRAVKLISTYLVVRTISNDTYKLKIVNFMTVAYVTNYLIFNRNIN